MVAESPPGLETQAFGLHVQRCENSAPSRRHRDTARSARSSSRVRGARPRSRTGLSTSRRSSTLLWRRISPRSASASSRGHRATRRTPKSCVWIDLLIAEAALAMRADRSAPQKRWPASKRSLPAWPGPLVPAQAARLRASDAARRRRRAAGGGQLQDRGRRLPRVRDALPPRVHRARARGVARLAQIATRRRVRSSGKRARRSSGFGPRPGSSAQTLSRAPARTRRASA